MMMQSRRMDLPPSSSSKQQQVPHPSTPICSACSLPPRRSKVNGEIIPLRKCSRCWTTAYHDTKCQRQHYATHKKVCRQNVFGERGGSSTGSAAIGSSREENTQKETTRNTLNADGDSPCFRIERGSAPRGNHLIATQWIKPFENLATPRDSFDPVAAPVLLESQRSMRCAICFARLLANHDSSSSSHLVLCHDRRYRVHLCRACGNLESNTHHMTNLRLEVEAVMANPQIPRILTTAILVYRMCVALMMNRNEVSSLEATLQNMIGHDLERDNPNAVVHEQAIVMTVTLLLQHRCRHRHHHPSVATIMEASRLQAMLARIKVNAFTITDKNDQESLGIGLYQTAHFINHSCRPNARQSFTVGMAGRVPTLNLTARAKGISAHEEVTISYLDTGGLTCQKRQAALQRSYHFTCTCAACREEIET